jgi:hypothetical protein
MSSYYERYRQGLHREVYGELLNLANPILIDLLGKRQKGAILPDSVDPVQAQNCQVGLTLALKSCWRNPDLSVGENALSAYILV